MRSLLLLSAFLLAATLSSTTGTYGSPVGDGSPVPPPTVPPLVGGWTPINNLSDPYVQKIARFALREINKKINGFLKLSRVVSGETQLVSGTNYHLVIEANYIDGSLAKFDAVVWDQPWNKHRELTSFHKVKY